MIEPILPDGHRAGDYSLSELIDRCRAGEGVPADVAAYVCEASKDSEPETK